MRERSNPLTACAKVRVKSQLVEVTTYQVNRGLPRPMAGVTMVLVIPKVKDTKSGHSI